MLDDIIWDPKAISDCVLVPESELEPEQFRHAAGFQYNSKKRIRKYWIPKE